MSSFSEEIMLEVSIEINFTQFILDSLTFLETCTSNSLFRNLHICNTLVKWQKNDLHTLDR